METAPITVPATLVGFLERRRGGSVPPRGMLFVERRRSAPVLVVEADDLHLTDADLVLADDLDDAWSAVIRVTCAESLADAIGPAAFAAHRLPARALDLLR